MIGLTNSGKTTILYKLKFDDYIKNENYFSTAYKKVEYKNLLIYAIAVGDECCTHQYYRQLFQNTDGLIFVFDSGDRFRFDEAKEVLLTYLYENNLQNTTLLILANKQDIDKAIKSKEIEEKFKLSHIKNLEWKIQECCAITGDGLLDGIQWIFEKIKNKSAES